MNVFQLSRFFKLSVLAITLNTSLAFALSPYDSCKDSTTELHLSGKKNTLNNEYDRTQHKRSEKVGLALSGGGSRALVLFEALSRFMQEPYRSKISRVSASSGGAWAITSIFMQPPDKLGAFLGSPKTHLGLLHWDNAGEGTPENNIANINPKRLATVAQRLSYTAAATSFFWPLVLGIPPLPGYDGWRRYLAKNLLTHYGLNATTEFQPSSFPGLGYKTELIINALSERS